VEKKMTEELLVDLDTYMKAGIHIGTKFRTKYMDPFIYKTRPDGLSVLNVQEIDRRIRIAAKFLAHYDSKDLVVVARRENAWRPAKLMGKYTGATIFSGRYRPGTLTNSKLDTFCEGKVLLATDAWPDRNAVKDGKSVGLAIVALCDTNNETNNIDLVVPCNNKGRQALGLMYFLLTREYCKIRGLDFAGTLEEFNEE
jgi:small subunit ribosomal protein S2